MKTIEAQVIGTEVEALLNESKDERNKIIAELRLGDEAYDLGEWVPVKTYAERFGLDAHIVYNHIRRGKVPTENVVIVSELNGLMLIKAVPYTD